MIEESRIKRIHFVGIGGAGMSGIAELLRNMGFHISGSDLVESETVKRLRRLGVRIAIGHGRANLGNAEALVYSSAVDHSNPEVAEALRRKLPVIPRAEMLAELMRMKFSIAVAGTHGKTTTTSMIAAILSRARLDPTFVVGGKLKAAGSGAKLGSSRFLVAEADESDGSFLKLLPTVAVVTNIENDHLEFYGRIGKLRQAFAEFANKVPFYGTVILNSDCPQVRRILPTINKKIITTGFSPGADVRADRVAVSMLSASYDLWVMGRRRGRIELPVGGQHNVANSLTAIAAALEVGIPLPTIRQSLNEFSLPERRFQVLYADRRYLVVDDYAHHPTEIRATLKTLRAGRVRRLIAVFQPHRYTRLQLLLSQFAAAFDDADWVIVSKLYTANQRPLPHVNGRVLSQQIRRRGHPQVRYLESFERIRDWLLGQLQEGDAVVFLSAGNLVRLAHEFAQILELRRHERD